MERGIFIQYGHDSLHRVSPVHGRRPRLAAVMCYEQTPGIVGSREMNTAIYGPRVAALQGGPGPEAAPAG